MSTTANTRTINHRLRGFVHFVPFNRTHLRLVETNPLTPTPVARVVPHGDCWLLDPCPCGCCTCVPVTAIRRA